MEKVYNYNVNSSRKTWPEYRLHRTEELVCISLGPHRSLPVSGYGRTTGNLIQHLMPQLLGRMKESNNHSLHIGLLSWPHIY